MRRRRRRSGVGGGERERRAKEEDVSLDSDLNARSIPRREIKAHYCRPSFRLRAYIR